MTVFTHRKVLIEKLLYSCSDLREIIILVRPKRGKSGEERVKDFAQIPVRNIELSCLIKIRLNLLTH